MALEWLTGSLIYSAVKDSVGGLLRYFKPMPPQQKIELRQKWKPRFEDHIRDHFAKKLRSDVIIRDVKRVDQYPETKEKEKGISAWFRLGLVGTYHRGILVAFDWNRLVDVGEGEFRFLDYDNDDQQTKDEALKVLQIGMIPFENIEDVDFEGDEYYGYPHIYCHFANRGEPYERVAYFTQNQLFDDSLPYHTEVVEAKAVRATSRKLGVNSPYI
ncbi:hypothetical protein FDP25_03140 [Roseovarius sp. A21]|uniref:Uncharacterized protein n=1 Tax=Roseovarius bejariae TaxID=2576383 RepID=A0A844CUQ7_9RHOB|nr:hypothetical protein [Roseovarius bejariae]